MTTSSKTLRPMTPAAVEAAARADRDAQPLTAGDLKRMKRTPQAKIIRRALALTQEEFAVRYHIPWALCGTGSKAAHRRTGQLKLI
jgi:DNA-binding transcriptional regulator YiaG